MDKAQIGKAGEDFACRILKEKGYRIVERNYHSRYGEIDIIAESGQALAFIEVKTRKQTGKTMPREAVDTRKQRKIILTAMLYLQIKPAKRTPRFDVFEVWHGKNGIYKFSHLENAFDLSSLGGEYELF